MLRIYRKVLNDQVLKKYFFNIQRATCSGRFPQLITQETLQNATNDASPKEGYGEKEIFLLGPTDFRTPLPGNIGIPPLSLLCIDTISQLPEPAGEKCEVIKSQLPEERYQNLLTQVACVISENVLGEFPIEFSGYDCPQLLRKDFADLFPSRDLNSGSLTVITLSQKTKNNMSEWSEDAEVERKSLESVFLTAAAAICTQLKWFSYWADFIQPNSGKPNFDSLTNATMFEADVRYRHLGFTIEDLGCCRILMHKEWGTHVFAGAIFTNAPLHDKEVQNILQRHQSLQVKYLKL